MTQSKAVVILSGGQDSTTCMAIAATQFEELYAITFDYGQRHRVEVESAEAVAKLLGAKHHQTLHIPRVLGGTSPLVSDNPLGTYASVEELPGGVEPTFVPGRNLLFLTLAANYATQVGARDLFTGLCQADYGGYFDCRQTFVDAAQVALGEAIYGDPQGFKIHTPLMDLSKSESVTLAAQVLGERFDEVFENTHTCYAGVRGGCGECHACLLRDRGFQEAGIADPLWRIKPRAGVLV